MKSAKESGMKQFYTVVLDRFKEFEGTYETEPYECGWADEAIVFFTIHELKKGASLKARIQISEDGIHWLDEGNSIKKIKAEGYYYLKADSNFGGWMRVAFECTGKCNITPSLALKG